MEQELPYSEAHDGIRATSTMIGPLPVWTCAYVYLHLENITSHYYTYTLQP